MIELNTSLSPGQAKFALLLEKFPFAKRFWDFEKREVDLEGVEEYIGGIASHQQALMVKFLVAVWLGEDKFHFDLIDAAGVLDPQFRQAVIEWFVDPFWP